MKLSLNKPHRRGMSQKDLTADDRFLLTQTTPTIHNGPIKHFAQASKRPERTKVCTGCNSYFGSFHASTRAIKTKLAHPFSMPQSPARERVKPVHEQVFERRIQITKPHKSTKQVTKVKKAVKITKNCPLMLKKILKPYRDNIAKERTQQLESLMKSKEELLQTQTEAKPPVKPQKKKSRLELAIELQEQLINNPSKYQKNFQLEVEMRQAFRKALDPSADYVDDFTDLGLSQKAQLKNNQVCSPKEARLLNIAKVTTKTLANLKEVKDQFDKADEDEVKPKNEHIKDFFYAVKQGDLVSVKKYLNNTRCLITDTDNVIL